MAAVRSGTRLGVYEVVGAIGTGGMGTVYRAKDTRLPRDAAIKVSAEKFSDRFAREAHAIASLNHPNITTLYDVGPDYLVMEMVEGPTLADRIRQGPLSLDEAAHIGKQIADALDYAHERGIVHRDLKPGNVKIRPDGVVKVLDFGLAKTGGLTVPNSDETPTMTAHQTAAGVIVGTFAYMAPEQLTGKAVDKRVDIWAFGCVFYEMLTGESVHQGDTSHEVMASVLRDEPDLKRVPAQARRLLKRCLEKDPQKRLRHIGDVMALLDEQPSGESSAVASALPVSSRGGPRWLWPAVGLIALIAAGAGVLVLAPWRSQPNAGQAVRFEVPESDKLRFFYGGAMAVSPDGHWMVFPATGEDGVARYWLRSLDTVEARPLSGTETAYVPAAWSGDSKYVIFSTLASATLKKVDIQGGPPQTITELSASVGRLNGATSNSGGVVIFGLSGGRQPLGRVPVSGGQMVPATTLAPGETGHRWPQFLPDGRHFLYYRGSPDTSHAGVYVGSIDAKPEGQSLKRLLATNREAYYARSTDGGPGHLIFLRDATLMSQPFDPGRLELSGEAVPIAEGVDSFSGQAYGLFSVSDTGALVYRGGAGAKLALTWFDATGNPASAFDAGEYANPSLSPDQTRIAVAAGPVASRDIAIVDVVRKTTTRLTFDPARDDAPVWSPDGKNIVFASDRTEAMNNGIMKMYVKPADGSGEERLLLDRPGVPTSWSRDGRFLFFTTQSQKNGADIWVLRDPLGDAREAKPYPVLETQFNEGSAQVSPDGRWIAYTSNESSPSDVYVRSFAPDGKPGVPGAKWLISKGLATSPRWSADGKRLFYVTVNGFDLMAVDIDTSKGFQAGTPRRLFTAPPPFINVGWDLTADAKRFVFVATPNGARTAPFTVVLNWAAALKK
jgi:Tol biopolymer transport system component